MVKCLRISISVICGLLPIAPSTCFAPYYEFTFGNRLPGVLDAPIYSRELDYFPGPDWANAKSGNTTNGFPAGDQVYNRGPLEGWKVMFMAAVGTVESGRELFPGTVELTLGSGPDAGYFPTTTVGFWLPTVGPPNPAGTFQVRVWDSQNYSTWQEINTGGWAGASALFTGTFGSVSTEFRSFSVGWLDSKTLAPYVVPEPSALTLLSLGAIAVMLTRRRLRLGRWCW